MSITIDKLHQRFISLAVKHPKRMDDNSVKFCANYLNDKYEVIPVQYMQFMCQLADEYKSRGLHRTIMTKDERAEYLSEVDAWYEAERLAGRL